MDVKIKIRALTIKDENSGECNNFVAFFNIMVLIDRSHFTPSVV